MCRVVLCVSARACAHGVHASQQVRVRRGVSVWGHAGGDGSDLA